MLFAHFLSSPLECAAHTGQVPPVYVLSFDQTLLYYYKNEFKEIVDSIGRLRHDNFHLPGEGLFSDLELAGL
jgi:hypothetical protein